MSDYSENKAQITAMRIKALREEKKLSLDKLRAELDDKCDLRISKDSLIKYEVSDKFHSSFGKVNGMSIEKLFCLAKCFDVSADYLLGNTDTKKADPKLRSTCEFTGLSEDSVNVLINYLTDDFDYYFEPIDLPPHINVLNTLFEKGYITALLKAFGRFLHYTISKNGITNWDDYYDEEKENIKSSAMRHLTREIVVETESILHKLIVEQSGYYLQRDNKRRHFVYSLNVEKSNLFAH